MMTVSRSNIRPDIFIKKFLHLYTRGSSCVFCVGIQSGLGSWHTLWNMPLYQNGSYYYAIAFIFGIYMRNIVGVIRICCSTLETYVCMTMYWNDVIKCFITPM